MKKYEQPINPNLFQVFFMSGFCGFPISFARHMWIVTNNKGKLSRWDVLIKKDYRGTSWGHLHLNMKEPFEPLGLFSIGGKSILPAKILGVCEGGDGSVAEKMVRLVESSPTLYPYQQEYSLLSPNSNTYIRWVLSHFPEVTIETPWNAFGKLAEVKV